MVVIGVTDEKLDVVDRWIKRKRPEYPIVVTSDRSLEEALGVRFFPTGAVIGPDGVITYAGSIGSIGKPLEEAADASDKQAFFPKDLKKFRKKLIEADLDDAYKELDKLAAKPSLDARTTAWVARFREYVEGIARSDFEAATRLAEKGLLHSAIALAKPLADSDRLPIAGEVGTWLAELEARPDYKDALKAGPLWDKAQDMEDGAEYTDAIKQYRVVMKRFEGTPIAELAMQRVADIIEAGLPGFVESCSACRAAKRACEKHHEKVKL